MQDTQNRVFITFIRVNQFDGSLKWTTILHLTLSQFGRHELMNIMIPGRGRPPATTEQRETALDNNVKSAPKYIQSGGSLAHRLVERHAFRITFSKGFTGLWMWIPPLMSAKWWMHCLIELFRGNGDFQWEMFVAVRAGFDSKGGHSIAPKSTSANDASASP